MSRSCHSPLVICYGTTDGALFIGYSYSYHQNSLITICAKIIDTSAPKQLSELNDIRYKHRFTNKTLEITKIANKAADREVDV